MESPDKPTELGNASGDESTWKEEPQTAAQSIEENTSVPEFNPNWRFYLAFCSLAVVTLAVSLDATSLSVALPIIAKKLNGTAIEAFWSGTSFMLTSTVFQPSYASFSHIFGRKPLVFVALTFFSVGAIIAAVSKNFAVMLVGRSLQGIGAGGMIALTEVIITDMVPLRERGKWFGFVSGMYAVGSVSGPIVGGAFAEDVSWRWIFWINLPIIGIGYVMVALFLKLQHTKSAPFVEQLKRIDWFGSVLFIASTTSVLIPISWGGVIYTWASWRTLVPLILGIAGLVAFAPYELYVAKEPMVRFSIFNNWSSRLVYFQTFIHGLILWSLLYYLPIYYEAVKDFSPIITGIAVFPETFTVAPASIVVGIITSITGRYKWALWVGWVLTVLGMGLLYLQDVHTSTAAWVFLNLVPGLGTGILFAGMGIAIPSSAAAIDSAYAVAFFSFFRAFGQGVGVAIGGTIFQNMVQKKLQAYPLLAPFAAEYSKDAAGLVQVIKAMQPGLAKTQLIQAYADSIKVIWVTMCGLAGVALMTCFFVREYSMDMQLQTEQGFKHHGKTGDVEASDVEKNVEKSEDTI
ncbi:MFS general substrate transporter [Hyaloscypha variabilis F]|uniref:MFS general substrate transporter n=1 Tax=Hyaloscypha variabilis (strain UAMH 11265 / GT02V1 / F) TaxID=1149755 RepID=A0A2J6R411_HYAVF|nr:MFS general substrate transporter [Hyaloscypha variabilis F]